MPYAAFHPKVILETLSGNREADGENDEAVKF